jgi:hypothetical protein
VVALGLQAVYDLRDTAGPTVGSLTKTLPADAGSLPAGSSAASTTVTTTGSGAFNGWDLTGYNVLTGNNITMSYVDVKFKLVKAVSEPVIQNSFGTTVNNTFTRVLFDGTNGCSAADAYQTVLELRGPATFAYCSFINIPHTGLNFADNLNMSYTFFGAPGQNAVFNVTHTEPITITGGASSIDRCCFDPLVGEENVDVYPTSTGPFIQARDAPINITVSNSIIMTRGVQMFYTLQVDGNVHGATVLFTNCAIQRPIAPNQSERNGGYVATAQGAGGLSLQFVNCVDADTAVPIPLNGLG